MRGTELLPWDKGRGGGGESNRPLDMGGGAVSQNNFFGPSAGPQFGPTIIGGGGAGSPAPPLDPPLHFMILEVLRMININFHLTMSLLNQELGYEN